MAKIPNKTIKELEEFLNRGCDYSGTSDIINETAINILNNYSDCKSLDEIELYWGKDRILILDEFINLFYDEILDKILNVLKTQE